MASSIDLVDVEKGDTRTSAPGRPAPNSAEESKSPSPISTLSSFVRSTTRRIPRVSTLSTSAHKNGFKARRKSRFGHKKPERNLHVRSLESCPNGYPRLAAFLDSDEGFMIYRRFGFVQSRLLLEKQDTLRELERQLEDYDRSCAVDSRKAPYLITRDRRPEDREAYEKLMQSLEKAFSEYGACMCSTLEFFRTSNVNYLV